MPFDQYLRNHLKPIAIFYKFGRYPTHQSFHEKYGQKVRGVYTIRFRIFSDIRHQEKRNSMFSCMVKPLISHKLLISSGQKIGILLIESASKG